MTNLMMRALSIMVLVTALALLSASVTRGQEADPAAIFRQYADAVNAGDVDGALALFTEDATWVRGGRCPPGACAGQAAVRAELEKDVADHHQIDIVDTQVSDNVLTARVELRTDGTRAAGVERIIQVFTVEFREDKISALQARPDLTDPQTSTLADRRLPTTGAGPASTTDTTLPLALPLGVGLLLVGGLLTALAFGVRTVARKG
ncbi:MAG: nuclear transport factor 2 family protein [Chloroflexi bacterium]|nr:nuclear transport factor 2 family protein [Chloroflexota bacterium]